MVSAEISRHFCRHYCSFDAMSGVFASVSNPACSANLAQLNPNEPASSGFFCCKIKGVGVVLPHRSQPGTPIDHRGHVGSRVGMILTNCHDAYKYPYRCRLQEGETR